MRMWHSLRSSQLQSCKENMTRDTPDEHHLSWSTQVKSGRKHELGCCLSRSIIHHKIIEWSFYTAFWCFVYSHLTAGHLWDHPGKHHIPCFSCTCKTPWTFEIVVNPSSNQICAIGNTNNRLPRYRQWPFSLCINVNTKKWKRPCSLCCHHQHCGA